jgi:hypothetical protein
MTVVLLSVLVALLALTVLSLWFVVYHIVERDVAQERKEILALAAAKRH